METVRRGDSWWRQGDDGTWYRWNASARAWEFADPDPARAPSAGPPAHFRAPRGVARVLTTLLATAAVLEVAAVVAALADFRMWDGAVRGAPVADAELAASELRLGLLSVALLAVLIATMPVFIIWFHRLYTNLPALGATQLRFGRGWAIGAWFVPILNLWRPKQIADDIWRASDPDVQIASGAQWRQRPVAGIVHLWWGLYLLSNLVSQAVLRFSLDAEGAAELRTRALAEAGVAGLEALSAVVTMWFVVQLTARQEQAASPGRTA